ncbi:MAG: Coenzyme F420 hydrogenase/dehydrogenase, beta subunit C-terminal domain [Parvibaculum sp.]
MSGTSSSTVERVLDGQLCTGCGLCASVASGQIAMSTVAPGSSRPALRDSISPHAEKVIAAACPGAVVESWPRAAEVHPYWGPSFRVATGHASDQDVRHKGSSGGALTALAVFALRSGLVDRVVHIAADPDRPTRNIVTCSTTESEIVEGAGSRYASSSPLMDIDRMLADGGAMAFIGKPCDVSALRRLGHVDPRVTEHIPLMLSFFCAGIPSHDGADRVLAAMGVEPQEVSAFRYRGNGWPGKARAETFDGRVAEMTYAESWGGHLSKEVQFRCKICPDGVGGSADVACADAWYGGESGYPSFDEEDGRSLIITRTAVGERLLSRALAAGDLTAEPLLATEIDAMQPSQARRKRLLRSRLLALAATFQAKPRMDGVMVREAAGRAGLGEEIKSFLGTVRRIVMGRR